jgi:hypothetical protein
VGGLVYTEELVETSTGTTIVAFTKDRKVKICMGLIILYLNSNAVNLGKS